MTDRFDYIAGTGFTLGANHGGTLTDTAQRLTEVAAATHKGYFKSMFIDMVLLIGGSEYLRFVDIINAQGFRIWASTK
jgi:hypothetical protein